MNVWFYIAVILFIICLFLIFKIIIMKISIKDIYKSITKIIRSDTNNLLTISTNDKDLKKLVEDLNKSLSDLRKLEIEYKQGNMDLKHSITNISHDLRTPLTAIRGYLDILDTKNLTKKQKDYMSIINIKVNDLIYLTERLFLYSRELIDIEKINKVSVCLNTELESIICGFYAQFKVKRIEPTITISKMKIVKELDLICFKRVIENIISNALKYSDGDLEIELTESGEIVFINHTTKLNKTSVEKMFNRYYTVESGKESSGIGLSIVKQLTEMMGGFVTATYKNKKLIIKVVFRNL